MRTLFAGVFNIILPKQKESRRISLKFFVLLIALPLVLALVSYCNDLEMNSPSILASSSGVLGGLLFAHAIFVFQLRSSYDARQIEPESDAAGNYLQEDLRVRPLIDEMFTGVLYASLIALFLTLFTATQVAFLAKDEGLNLWITAFTVAVLTHLVGCIWHVISATTTAYSTLKKHDDRKM